jgi:hypothetical protein
MAAKKDTSDKIIADQAKDIAALKSKLAAKEARETDGLKNQVDWAKKLLDITNSRSSALNEARSTSDKIKNLEKEIAEYQQYAVDNGKSMNKEEKKLLGTVIKAGKEQKDQAKILMKQQLTMAKVADIEKQALPAKKQLVETQAKLNKFQTKYKESVSDSLGFVDKIDDSIREIPIVGDFLSKALNTDKLKGELEAKVGKTLDNVFMRGTVKAKESSEQAISGYDAQINALNGVEGAADGVSSSMTGAADGAAGMEAGLMGAEGAGVAAEGAAVGANAAMGPLLPIALAIAGAVMLIKKAFEIDAEITDFAKKMGTSKEEALETHEQIAEIAKETKVIGANMAAMTEASIDLNKALGTNRQISKEMLESQVLLTKQYGMTGESAAEFQQMSAGMGKTAPQMTQEIKRTSEMYSKMTGDSINFKDITADIAKTSKSTLSNYKGNVAALTKAAIQAKKIGMSLDETAQVSDKLLDIETSLENTMKANVLTGKHMNMDKARGLALDGDSAGAAAAAVEQVGDLNEFTHMNVLQKKAVADAAGVTVEQLVKAADLEKYSQALGGEKIKDMKDLTAEQIKQLETQGAIGAEDAAALETANQKASAQDKINALTDKLTAIFAELAGPLMEIIDPLSDMISFILPAIMPLIKAAFFPIFAVMDVFKGIGKILDGDIIGGIMDIGEGLARWFLTPLMFVIDLMDGIWPGFTDGIKAVGSTILEAIKWPFVKAYDWIANLFVGNSPSKLGEGILDGIASIGSSLLDFITAPFVSAWDFITGIFSGDIGIVDALKSVGGAIFDTLTAPFTMIMDFIGGLFNVDNLGTMIVDGVKGIGSSIVDGIAGIGSSIVDGVTAPFNSAFDWVSDKASAAMDFLPSWLGGSDEEEASEGGATATKVSDAQIDPSGGLVVSGAKGTYQLDKQDSVVAGTDLGKGAGTSTGDSGMGGLGDLAASLMGGVSALIGGGSSAPAQDNSEIASLLKQLIAATSQPVSINIGGKVIDEIEKQTTLRKTYNTKMDSAHGAF